mgnify:CR=1 FL=1
MLLRPSGGSKDLGGKAAKDDTAPSTWLGAALASNGNASRFVNVLAGSPAERAGIAPGDEAVALDGQRLNADNIDSRLRDHHVGDTVTVTVFRDHRLMRHRVTLESPPDDTCVLSIDEDARGAADEQRTDWLG